MKNEEKQKFKFNFNEHDQIHLILTPKHVPPNQREPAGLRASSKLVIQGSHMVSGTRCSAWSDQVK